MNTSDKQPVSPQTPEPDELITPKSSDKSMVTLVVHTAHVDVLRTVGRVEREKELEEEARQAYEKARKLMEEADQWDLRLKDRADWQMANAKIQARDDWRKRLEGHLHFNSADSYTDSISFKRKISDIERWQAGDGRREFVRTALGKLLEALEIIRGVTLKEASTLRDELVAKFSSLLNEDKRMHKESNPRTHAESSATRHKILVEFLKIARGFFAEDGLPVGLEENIKAGIDELMEYSEWEGSMDQGMDLLELVCPFGSATAEKMFKMIMAHLDRLMKMDLEIWLTAPASLRWKRAYPDMVKEEEKEWKNYYQKACNDILRRNNLPKHKFKRKGGDFAVGNHWG